jgi:hypothetical protein
VVPGGKPENGNGVEAATRDLVRPANGGDGFVQAEGWTGEERDLLARDNCDSPPGKTIEIARRGRVKGIPSAEKSILLAKDFHDAAANSGVQLDFAGCGCNTRGSLGMAKILCDAREILNKSGEELGRMRKVAKGNTVGLHRSGHNTRHP